jgi:tRNA modification GTPase
VGAEETIVAVATPPGRGAIGVVRVSGIGVPAIAERLLGGLPPARQACYRAFCDESGETIDQGIALYFPAPRSFTGEPVLELQGHGGNVVLDLLIARVINLGARPARPGEFSERAFLSGKIDLAQAEAIADLIDSATARAARAAIHSLEGEFSRSINALVESLTQLRVEVEAAIDFPEEEIDFLSDQHIASGLECLRNDVTAIRTRAVQGRLLRDGMTLAIVGPPNAGKSSLLNRLTGRDSAIVTHVPGTTRDLIRERINVDGIPLNVIDTAGLRASDDPVEQEGVRRAKSVMEAADLILVVVDNTLGPGTAELDLVERMRRSIPVILVRNKIDLQDLAPARSVAGDVEVLTLSARTGAGVDLLRTLVKEKMGATDPEGGSFMARRRHVDALERASGRLEEGHARLHVDHAGELLAEELRLAQQALSEITGVVTSDELLGRIFSSFCIGK